ncbi:unnamed protein product [Parajaminaea phylloscopi]
MLEATMIVLDDSEWMRNGDFPPTRWDAQVDASRILFDAKVGSNPESKVGLMTMAGRSPRVLASLTQEMGKMLSSLHGTEVSGTSDLPTAINIAQLALKHRQNKSQQQRIVVFVGSPISASDEQLVTTGKKLKKNNVALDVVSFGEEVSNEGKLQKLLDSVNSGDNSHLVTVASDRNQLLSDCLLSSPILMDTAASGAGQGSGSDTLEFGVDPNMDPELAMALRMSLEEEQARQRAAEGPSQQPSLAPISEASDVGHATDPSRDVASNSTVVGDATSRVAATASMSTSGPSSLSAPLSGSSGEETEDALLQRALSLSRGVSDTDVHMDEGPAAATDQGGVTAAVPGRALPGEHNDGEDEEMTEEEAIAHAIQLSLQDGSDDAEQPDAPRGP